MHTGAFQFNSHGDLQCALGSRHLPRQPFGRASCVRMVSYVVSCLSRCHCLPNVSRLVFKVLWSRSGHKSKIIELTLRAFMHGADWKHDIHAKSPILRAAKISPGESGILSNGTANFDEVTYYAVRTAALGERRVSPRRRTRLRSGKVVDSRSAYLIDCQIYDWSGTGARLRLFDNISVPGRDQLFEVFQKE